MEQALESFDGQILAEREVLAERSNRQPSGSAGGSPTLPTDAGASAAGTAGNGGTSSPGTASRGGARPAPAMPGRGPGGQSGQGQSGAPDAKDDDIIARQLREAAMAEPDPELREKLWEEYRRYKGS